MLDNPTDELQKLSNQQPAFNFHLLPEELVFEIFRYLLPEQVLNILKVSKQWQYLAKNDVIWEEKLTIHFPGPYAIAKSKYNALGEKPEYWWYTKFWEIYKDKYTFCHKNEKTEEYLKKELSIENKIFLSSVKENPSLVFGRMDAKSLLDQQIGKKWMGCWLKEHFDAAFLLFEKCYEGDERAKLSRAAEIGHYTLVQQYLKNNDDSTLGEEILLENLQNSASYYSETVTITIITAYAALKNTELLTRLLQKHEKIIYIIPQSDNQQLVRYFVENCGLGEYINKKMSDRDWRSYASAHPNSMLDFALHTFKFDCARYLLEQGAIPDYNSLKLAIGYCMWVVEPAILIIESSACYFNLSNCVRSITKLYVDNDDYDSVLRLIKVLVAKYELSVNIPDKMHSNYMLKTFDHSEIRNKFEKILEKTQAILLLKRIFCISQRTFELTSDPFIPWTCGGEPFELSADVVDDSKLIKLAKELQVPICRVFLAKIDDATKRGYLSLDNAIKWLQQTIEPARDGKSALCGIFQPPIEENGQTHKKSNWDFFTPSTPAILIT